MTEIQKQAVQALFFIYGNAGPKHTRGNHHFLHCKLEGEGDAEHFQPVEQCKADFAKVMSGDFSPLPPVVRKRIEQAQEAEQHWREVIGFDSEEE